MSASSITKPALLISPAGHGQPVGAQDKLDIVVRQAGTEEGVPQARGHRLRAFAVTHVSGGSQARSGTLCF